MTCSVRLFVHLFVPQFCYEHCREISTALLHHWTYKMSDKLEKTEMPMEHICLGLPLSKLCWLFWSVHNSNHSSHLIWTHLRWPHFIWTQWQWIRSEGPSSPWLRPIRMKKITLSCWRILRGRPSACSDRAVNRSKFKVTGLSSALGLQFDTTA